MLIRREKKKQKNSAASSCRLHVFIDTNKFIAIQDFGSKTADTKNSSCHVCEGHSDIIVLLKTTIF